MPRRSASRLNQWLIALGFRGRDRSGAAENTKLRAVQRLAGQREGLVALRLVLANQLDRRGIDRYRGAYRE